MPRPPLTILGPPVLDALMRDLPCGLMLVSGKDLEVVTINEQGCQFLRRPREALEGRTFAAVADELTLIAPSGEVADLPQLPLWRACNAGEIVRGEQWTLEHEDGERTVAVVNATPIYEDGCIVGGFTCWTDVTHLKAIENGLRECVATETVLLRESNHRIKNHLQMLAGLVRLEARRPGVTVGELAETMEDRLSVLAAAHEGFYSSRSRGAVKAASLLEWVVRPLDTAHHPIHTACPSDLDLDDGQVTPVALAINEAVSNALKHAFPDGRPGGIVVSLEREPGWLALTIADEGKGLCDQGGKRGLGTQILGALARQLGGTFSLQDRHEGGAVVSLRFPEMPADGAAT